MRSGTDPRRLVRRLLGATAIVALAASAAPRVGARQADRARGPADRTTSLALDSGVTILVGAEEPQPVAAAAQDLAADFAKVLGTAPRIVHRPEDAGGAVVLVGFNSPLVMRLRARGTAAPGSYSLSVVRTGWQRPRPARAVLLTGADMRGTMYAVYSFSERYLGVDPLYYWTDRVPARRDRVEVPASLDEHVAAPVFKYRGFFINDEDLLTGWAPGSRGDGTGISLAVWNKIYETILRLRGNIVAPGTWIFPDEPQVALAARRGLIITQHHAIPVGLNVARWPEGVPYSYSAHPDILERAWTNAVKAYPPDQEVLWTVGLRGLSDVSYAAFDPSVRGDNHALGQLVGAAIAEQVRIVRSVHPHAEFITNLWQEGARLVQQGDLAIPAGVSTVWADDGYGNLQDGGTVSAGQGAYYHVAMMNGRANQLTEMVPVERIYSELGRYIAAGATHYLLLNTSDIRPVSMTMKAVMDVGWNGVPNGGPSAAAEYYRRWSADEFGDGASAPVAAVYEQYFKAPAHTTGRVSHEYGDQLYHTEARRMLLTAMLDGPLYSIPSQAPTWMPPRVVGAPPGAPAVNQKQWLHDTVAAEIERCGEAQPRWDAAWQAAQAAEASVASDRRDFYRAHVLAMVTIDRESNRMLRLVAQAIQSATAGRPADARPLLADALRACDAIAQAEAAAEYGPWKGWYAGDWLTNVRRTRETIEIYSRLLDDPRAPLPAPFLWDWEAYYHIMHYEGERSADVQ